MIAILCVDMGWIRSLSHQCRSFRVCPSFTPENVVLGIVCLASIHLVNVLNFCLMLLLVEHNACSQFVMMY